MIRNAMSSMNNYYRMMSVLRMNNTSSPLIIDRADFDSCITKFEDCIKSLRMLSSAPLLTTEKQIFGTYTDLVDIVKEYVKNTFSEDFSAHFDFNRVNIRISNEQIKRRSEEYDVEKSNNSEMGKLSNEIRGLLKKIQSEERQAKPFHTLSNLAINILKELLVCIQSILDDDYPDQGWSWIYEEFIEPYENEFDRIADEIKRNRIEQDEKDKSKLGDYKKVLELYEEVRKINISYWVRGSFLVKENDPMHSVITLYPYVIEKEAASIEEKVFRKVAVFIHELFHAMHYYYLADMQRFSGDPGKARNYWTKDKRWSGARNTVVESLADSFTCGLLSELGTNDSTFKDIIHTIVVEKQESWNKFFYPGWPYSGAKKIFDGRLELDLFMRILQTTKTSWSKAYDLIENEYCP